MRAWLFFVLSLVALATGLLHAQPRRTQTPVPIEDLTPQTAGVAIETFRSARFAGDFCFRFELTHFPRKEKETVYEGFLWGGAVEGRSAVRLVFWKKGEREVRRQFLMRNGPMPEVWTGGLGDPVRKVEQAEQYAPLMDGLLYSPFDVMMPFVYWPDWTYEGPKRVQSRQTDLFFFAAPESWKAEHPEQKGIRVALDRIFNALIYAQLVGNDEKTLRTFRIVDLKKVQEQWIVKRIDFFDEATREKDRFSVVAAAMNLALPAGFFTPQSMEKEPKIPQKERFEVFE